jgi:dTDP-4-amino-4,6-dideoxygalactose transaminase
MKSKSAALRKMRNWTRYFYRVPWCVPAWGAREFFLTIKCLMTLRIVRGSYPERAAAAVKDYLGVRYALPVNRGRTAIELALRALRLGADDEVVLPSYVCQSVLDAVLQAGARPVFADVGRDLNVTAQTVRDALTPQTKCVIVAHLFGNVAPVDEIEELLEGTGVALIDDAAQSFGARRKGRLLGTFGVCGIVSCGPGKTLAGAAGGLLVTNERELYATASAFPLPKERARHAARRLLSFWAWRRFRKLTLPFKNILDRVWRAPLEAVHESCAMSNIDGAIMLAQLRACERNTALRRRHASVLLASLGGLARASVTDTTVNGMLVKLILVLPREAPPVDEAISLLARDGIECEAGYTPLHLKYPAPHGSLKTTEAVWQRVLCIPLETEWKRKAEPLLLSQKWSGVEHSAGQELPSIKESGVIKESGAIEASETSRGEERLMGELVGPIAVRQGNDR